MENKLLEIPNENIILEFELEGNMYAIISETEELEEDGEVYFAKIEYLDEIKIIRHIESDEEYEKVLEEYNRLSEIMEEGEEDE